MEIGEVYVSSQGLYRDCAEEFYRKGIDEIDFVVYTGE